jgi:hypothetical protein
MTDAWGDGDAGPVDPSESESLPNGGDINLGNGHRFVLDNAVWRSLTHHPAVVAAITARANEIADAANSMVNLDARTKKRLDNGQPAYVVSVQNRGDTTRARAKVKASGLLGLVDDAANATLWKAMLGFPSDPVLTGDELALDGVEMPEESGVEMPEESGGEAAGED